MIAQKRPNALFFHNGIHCGKDFILASTPVVQCMVVSCVKLVWIVLTLDQSVTIGDVTLCKCQLLSVIIDKTDDGCNLNFCIINSNQLKLYNTWFSCPNLSSLHCIMTSYLLVWNNLRGRSAYSNYTWFTWKYNLDIKIHYNNLNN